MLSTSPSYDLFLTACYDAGVLHGTSKKLPKKVVVEGKTIQVTGSTGSPSYEFVRGWKTARKSVR